MATILNGGRHINLKHRILTQEQVKACGMNPLGDCDFKKAVLIQKDVAYNLMLQTAAMIGQVRYHKSMLSENSDRVKMYDRMIDQELEFIQIVISSKKTYKSIIDSNRKND